MRLASNRKTLDRARKRARIPAAWLVLGKVALGAILGFGLFDRVLMPLAVHHGTDAQVPDLRGRLEDEGVRSLAAARLDLGEVLDVPDADARAGSVISQDPGPGARVRKGRRVSLVVSLGPPVRRVPDLARRTARSAAIELSQLGLKAGASLVVACSSRPDGEIIGTRPGTHGVPDRSGTVDLLLSGGPAKELYAMPDLRGLAMDDAVEQLKAAGIDVVSRGGAGPIRSQDPAPGSPIWSGDRARLD